MLGERTSGSGSGESAAASVSIVGLGDVDGAKAAMRACTLLSPLCAMLAPAPLASSLAVVIVIGALTGGFTATRFFSSLLFAETMPAVRLLDVATALLLGSAATTGSATEGWLNMRILSLMDVISPLLMRPNTACTLLCVEAPKPKILVSCGDVATSELL